MTEQHPGQSVHACTCHRDPETGARITTVACMVHHLMPDGTPAGLVEVGCEGCMKLGDVRSGEFAWYDVIDPDVPAIDRGEAFRCKDCGDYGVANGTLRFKERAEA